MPSKSYLLSPKIWGVIVLIQLLPFFGYGQGFDRNIFQFLHAPFSPHIAASGGYNVSHHGGDALSFAANPALVDSALSQNLSVSHVFMPADLGYSSVAYGWHSERTGSWTAAIQYLNYGEFQGFDVTGAETVDFNPYAMVARLGKSHQLGLYTLGMSMNLIHSDIFGFSASALALDLGGQFNHPEKDLQIGLAIKNVGWIFSDYSDQSDNRLPFDVQVGASFKPEYMPFRFHLTAYNLATADVVFFDPNSTVVLNPEEPSAAEQALRRIAFGTELVLSKSVQLRLGYNHAVRRELVNPQIGGVSGFSFGGNINSKYFDIAYTHSAWHLAGGLNTLSLRSNIALWY
ncbi:MAG: type IX secretion system protein PorQ [Cyclobacteriaceae bacterium]|nr:type IX secretion system protein PorQ [Cyclobacteriaceae bacterium]MCH8516861.1 type IX secretion system protein PorQ [Cyclobacteriaceae bacterium]